MYKLKYYSLTKEEKEDLKKTFYATEFGNNIKARLDRLFIIGILAFIVSIILFFTKANIWDLIMAISLLLSSFIFIFASFRIRITKLNNYLIKLKKK